MKNVKKIIATLLIVAFVSTATPQQIQAGRTKELIKKLALIINQSFKKLPPQSMFLLAKLCIKYCHHMDYFIKDNNRISNGHNPQHAFPEYSIWQAYYLDFLFLTTLYQNQQIFLDYPICFFYLVENFGFRIQTRLASLLHRPRIQKSFYFKSSNFCCICLEVNTFFGLDPLEKYCPTCHTNFVHRSCMKKYITTNPNFICLVCRQPLQTVGGPFYSFSLTSMIKYLCPGTPRRMFKKNKVLIIGLVYILLARKKIPILSTLLNKCTSLSSTCLKPISKIMIAYHAALLLLKIPTIRSGMLSLAESIAKLMKIGISVQIENEENIRIYEANYDVRAYSRNGRLYMMSNDGTFILVAEEEEEEEELPINELPIEELRRRRLLRFKRIRRRNSTSNINMDNINGHRRLRRRNSM